MQLRLSLLIVAMAVATGLAVLWVWLPATPLGVPGEWTWPRLPYSAETLIGWGVSAVVAATLIGLVHYAARSLDQAQSRGMASKPFALRQAAWISAVIVATAGWWLVLLSETPEPYGLGKSPFVLYYGRTTGYFWEARYASGSIGEFLRGYENMLATRPDAQRYLHIGTHPPGMILGYKALLATLDAAPGLVNPLKASMPRSIRDANRQIASDARASGREFLPKDEACLWLATLITLGLCALTIAPLHVMLRRLGLGSGDALRWSALWAFVPAVCVFLPKCDTAFAAPGLLVAVTWLAAWDRKSFLLAFIAGLLCLAGLFVSLVFLPVVAWCGLSLIAAGIQRPTPDGSANSDTRLVMRVVLGAVLGVAVPIAVLWATPGISMPHIWQLNFLNHAEFYQHFERTKSAWLGENVVEMMFSVGPALAVLAAAGLWANNSPRLWGDASWRRVVAPGIAVLLLLWLSGKNQGELARLWIPLFPWVLIAAGHSVGRLSASSRIATAPPMNLTSLWLAAATFQALAAILTSTRIDGFGFTELAIPPPNG
jgi:hypothetical protein